jgi:hypothetical protein
MVLSDQLTDLFENIFPAFLCAFKKGHGCQIASKIIINGLVLSLDTKKGFSLCKGIICLNGVFKD